MKKLRFSCSACNNLIEVVGPVEKMIELVATDSNDYWRCPTCGRGMTREMHRHTDLATESVTVDEFWKLNIGPKDQTSPAAMSKVSELLTGSIIKSVGVRIEEDRCIIDTLETNRCRCHFTASGLGAVIYRMEEENASARTDGEPQL